MQLPSQLLKLPSRRLKQSLPQRFQKCHKFPYFKMKNSGKTSRFARAIFIFHIPQPFLSINDVNDLFCVECGRHELLTAIFFLIFNPLTLFASQSTSTNRETIKETRSYISRRRPLYHRLHLCSGCVSLGKSETGSLIPGPARALGSRRIKGTDSFPTVVHRFLLVGEGSNCFSITQQVGQKRQ